MADVNKIQLPDTSTVNIKDYRIPGVDETPTSGSDNVVTSGGIYTSLSEKAPLEVISDDTENNTYLYKSNGLNRKVYTDVCGVANGSAPNNNTYANQSFYFLTIKPTSWDAQWSVKYIVNVHLDDETQKYKSSATASVVNVGLLERGVYDCNLNGTAGTYNTFHMFQSQKNTSYRPIYYHMIHETTADGFTAGYGHKIGVSLTSSYLPSPVTDYSSGSAVTNTKYSRTIEVILTEAINCTAELSDDLEVEGDAYRSDYTKLNTTYYPTNTSASNSAGRWSNLSATAQGLYESSDDNTVTYTQQTYNYLKNATKNGSTGLRIFGYALIGFNKDGNALGISVLSSSQTTNTTGVSVKGTRLYCTEGFDYTKGFRYTNSSAVFVYDADVNISSTINHSTIDLRYSDNCVPTSAANNLGMVVRKPVYLRGTIGSDGLFYLAPIDVTYNNATYQRAWVQDIPTSQNEDGEYVYWCIGYPYYNSSYPGAAYQINLITEGNALVWYKNGSIRPYAVDPQDLEDMEYTTAAALNDLDGRVNILEQGSLSTETDPVFTASAAYGITSSDITNWNSKTSNTGTITGITMNGVSKGTSGVVDLGTVITSHAQHKLNATNGTASAVNQGTEITYVESVSGTTTATSGDLSVSTTRKKVTIPTAVTESTVSGWGFTKNTGTLTSHADHKLLIGSASATANSGNTITYVESLSGTTTATHGDLTVTPTLKTATIPAAPGTLNTTATTAQSTSASEALSGSVTLHKVAKTGTYSDLIGKPTIPAAPGTLITNATTAQTSSAGEAMSGNITLHKVSKTGDYGDLLNTPTVDSTPTASSTNLVTSGGVNTAVEGVRPRIYMGTCSTAAATVAKVVTTETFPLDANDQPLVGTVIGVKFTNTNSATSPTLNVNSTGAYSIYYNASVYSGSSTIGGSAERYAFYVWDGTYWCFLSWGVDNNDNTNTIGYQIRSNSYSKVMNVKVYRYRLLFSAPDGHTWVAANASSSTSADTAKTVTTAKIDPFGPIVYYGSTSAISAGSSPGATALWTQYHITLGYSFNRTGAALTLTSKYPVLLKCTPQDDGSVIIDPDTPYVQAFPSTDDGKVYIYLGVATSATQVELLQNKPVYYYKNGALRLWTNNAPDITRVEYEADQEVTAAALNDLNDRLENIDIPDSEEMTSITYTELVALKNGNQLKPGHQYRITDYVCDTLQQNTRALNNSFDIIVTANSTNKLDDNARAIRNSNSNSYFCGDLSRWELKYTLTNEDGTIWWAGEYGKLYIITYNSNDNGYRAYVRHEENDYNGYYCWYITNSARAVGWYDYDSFYTTVSNPTTSTVLYVDTEGTQSSDYSISQVKTYAGTGAIYYMKDDYENVAFHDFKNIQFKRYVTISDGQLYFGFEGITAWSYTYSCIVYDSGNNSVEVLDLTNLREENSYDYGWSYPQYPTADNYVGPHFCSGGSQSFASGQLLNDVIAYAPLPIYDSYMPMIRNTYLESDWTFGMSIEWGGVDCRFADRNYAENTNNKVTTVTKDSSDYGYPSAKAAYKLVHPTRVTSGTNFSPNVPYFLGYVTGSKTWTLNTSGIDNSIANHYFWTFETGATPPTITWPSGLTWPGGLPPAINANKHYEISVLDNIVAWMEV